MKNILITGGCGFIGSKLTASLLHQGYNVIIVDNLNDQIHGTDKNYNKFPEVKIFRLDVESLSENYKILDNVDIVYHLASETGTTQSMYKIGSYVSSNVQGTASLLDAIAKSKSKNRKIILTSSRSVYGEGCYVDETTNKEVYPKARIQNDLELGLWEHFSNSGDRLIPIATKETMPISPESIYASTKYSQELLLKNVSNSLNLNATVLRLQNVYGSGQSLRNPYTGIIAIFYNRARQGLEIEVYEDGLESRDFVHINDIVDALTSILETDLENNSILNLGSGLQTSVLDLAKTLIKCSGLNSKINITGNYRLGDIRHCFANIEKARKDLNFNPKVDLETGLMEFVTWANNQPIYEDKSHIAKKEFIDRRLGR